MHVITFTSFQRWFFDRYRSDDIFKEINFYNNREKIDLILRTRHNIRFRFLRLLLLTNCPKTSNRNDNLDSAMTPIRSSWCEISYPMGFELARKIFTTKIPYEWSFFVQKLLRNNLGILSSISWLKLTVIVWFF